MRMYDLIVKKRNKEELSKAEIEWMIQEYTNDHIPDYQMSAMLMAIYLNEMTKAETAALTIAMANSGDRVDLSSIEGMKIDKHSTGGVGDKTTLIVAPIAAACGVKVAKMSGKGLGHTGGTIDKLESIPGFQTVLSREAFFHAVEQTGLSLIGQSGNLAPADKKLYALRDVTATVESIPLIASSIMSKKLAAGSDGILLDVKVGSGAFMSTVKEATKLAEEMIAIGEYAGKKMAALLTNMDIPLGCAIGNSLEVIEAIETLKGNGPEDLTELCLLLATEMLLLAGHKTRERCRQMVEEVLHNGKALECFCAMVKEQGGDLSVIHDTTQFQRAPYSIELLAKEEGYVFQMDTRLCGMASVQLGAGRETKESEIDKTAGILLKKKTGDKIGQGDCLAVLYASKKEKLEEGQRLLEKAYKIGKEKQEKEPLLYKAIVGE